MNRKNLPLLLMLVSGIVTCIYTFILRFPTLKKLVSLFIVLLIFYFLGSIMKWTLDYFEEQIEKRLQEEGEVIEKGSAEEEGTESQEGTPGEEAAAGEEAAPGREDTEPQNGAREETGKEESESPT